MNQGTKRKYLWEQKKNLETNDELWNWLLEKATIKNLLEVKRRWTTTAGGGGVNDDDKKSVIREWFRAIPAIDRNKSLYDTIRIVYEQRCEVIKKRAHQRLQESKARQEFKERWLCCMSMIKREAVVLSFEPLVIRGRETEPIYGAAEYRKGRAKITTKELDYRTATEFVQRVSSFQVEILDSQNTVSLQVKCPMIYPSKHNWTPREIEFSRVAITGIWKLCIDPFQLSLSHLTTLCLPLDWAQFLFQGVYSSPIQKALCGYLLLSW